jgi:inward rectifier potassium channel
MGALGSTRVFGRHGGGGVVTIGLARRPMRDLYHWLVTGPWVRVAVVFALVYFATQALFGVARLALAVRLPADGPFLASLLDAREAPTLAPGEPLSARALAAGVLAAVDRFVHWAELVLGAGVVLAKFSLVRARVLFSNVAVVAPHEQGQALVFRMANERASHIVDAKVSVMLVRNEVQGGEVLRRAHDLRLARGGSALFAHAWTAIHPIDRGSPLQGETAESLAAAEAEIVVNVSGFDEGLMRTVHTLHVYPASRVRWNARFREIVKLLPDGRRAVDYRKFHKTTPLGDAPSDASSERTPARRARST